MSTYLRVNVGSGNVLPPVRRRDITWTNVDILPIEPFETNFSEIFIEIPKFQFNKMRLNMLSAKCQEFCSELKKHSMHYNNRYT